MRILQQANAPASATQRGIKRGEHVIFVGPRTGHVIPEPQIKRQVAASLPIVLEEKTIRGDALVLAQGRAGSWRAAETGIYIAQQKVRQGVSRCRTCEVE